jgi:hypothetical protein
VRAEASSTGTVRRGGVLLPRRGPHPAAPAADVAVAALWAAANVGGPHGGVLSRSRRVSEDAYTGEQASMHGCLANL